MNSMDLGIIYMYPKVCCWKTFYKPIALPNIYLYDMTLSMSNLIVMT